ncbi:myosin-IIIb-like isoform X2 [Asterias amurensis]|uniref:myosin-IIIb-like isoform X2 n=1 Tax=Asterias amurensis TaxID=7602 RepID=UPI003AB59758
MADPDVPVGTTDDLASLGRLDESILLNELKHRYNNDRIYTYVGDILVAVNPFRDIGIYGQQQSELYKNKRRTDNPPHIFAVSDSSYQAMITGSAVGGKRNQCIVISGESGAGKTESTKFIIKQLIELCKGKSQLEQQILQVNPLLEAFGNAQTTMNDNSSRFGKYIQLKFQEGKVMGAKISEYLLEKSRVVFQNKGEENFHIFYYMFAGLSPEQQKKYKMSGADKYKYLTNGPSLSGVKRLKDMLAELTNAMDLVGFLDTEQDEMFSILASTLMMGEIELDANDDDAAYVKGSAVSSCAVSSVSELLGINEDELKQVLTFNLSSARGDVFQRNYTKHQAQDARDAVAKTLYGRLFSWIVNKVNQLLAPELSLNPSDTTEIGILDIFGFEQFQTNSFEQLCINLANEQLQYFFNQHIFLLEQEEYKAEGIDWSYVAFVNNQSLLDLFLAKPIGIVALLDEECRFPQATDHTFVEKLTQNFSRNHHFIKAKVSTSNNFSIDHYAGRVEYNANLFLEKNRDTLPSKVMQMLRSSTNDLVSQIFRGTVTRTGTLALQSRRKSRKSVKQRLGNRNTMKNLTVGAQFKNSLSILLELLNLANPHFVRCVKPNTTKAPKTFQDKFVTAQLRYTGMLETTRIRRLGYALRPQFADFVKRYRVLARSPKLAADKNGCVKILKSMGMTDWHAGKTKLFLKYYHQDFLEEQMQRYGESAVHIQKIVRGFLARCRFKALVKNAKRQEEEMNSYLLQMAKMSLDFQQKMSKIEQGDKKIPKAFFESIRKGDKVVSIESPASQNKAPETANKESSEEDDDDDDDDDDEIIEDEFVRIKKNLFGKEGTRQASVHWFKATQSMAARDPSGVFAKWFHGIITRRRAEDLLTGKEMGYFLIRVSESRFGYSLSVLGETRCKHFMIDLTPTGKYIIVGERPVFPDLQGLVKYYQANPVSPFGDILKVPCGQDENELDYAELLADRRDKRGSGVPSSIIRSLKEKKIDADEAIYSTANGNTVTLPDPQNLGVENNARSRPVSEASYLYVDSEKTVGVSKLSRHSARRSAVRESKSGGIRRKSTDQF